MPSHVHLSLSLCRTMRRVSAVRARNTYQQLCACHLTRALIRDECRKVRVDLVCMRIDKLSEPAAVPPRERPQQLRHKHADRPVSVDHVRDQRPQRRADDPIILRPRGAHLRRYALCSATAAGHPAIPSGRVCRSAWKGLARPQRQTVRWQCCAVLCCAHDSMLRNRRVPLPCTLELSSRWPWRIASAGNVTLAKLRLKHALQ